MAQICSAAAIGIPTLASVAVSATKPSLETHLVTVCASVAFVSHLVTAIRISKDKPTPFRYGDLALLRCVDYIITLPLLSAVTGVLEYNQPLCIGHRMTACAGCLIISACSEYTLGTKNSFILNAIAVVMWISDGAPEWAQSPQYKTEH